MYLCSSVPTENFLQFSFSPFSIFSALLLMPHTKVPLCNHRLPCMHKVLNAWIPRDERSCSLARPHPYPVPARSGRAAVYHQIRGTVSSRGYEWMRSDAQLTSHTSLFFIPVLEAPPPAPTRIWSLAMNAHEYTGKAGKECAVCCARMTCWLSREYA